MRRRSKRSPRAYAAAFVFLAASAASVTSCGSGGGSDSETVVESTAIDATVETSEDSTAVPATNTDGSGPPTTTVADTDGTTPASPATQVDSAATGVLPEGFTTVVARVTAADGEVCEVCLWLADTEEERGRGLMGVTDLGPAGGMAFLFDPATTGSFYMFRTPTPLSIAWFAQDGAWVGSAEMEPCLDESPGRCPLYSPDGAEYTVAVEAFEGGLDEWSMVEGSVIELLDGTEQLECQTPSS